MATDGLQPPRHQTDGHTLLYRMIPQAPKTETTCLSPSTPHASMKTRRQPSAPSSRYSHHSPSSPSPSAITRDDGAAKQRDPLLLTSMLYSMLPSPLRNPHDAMLSTPSPRRCCSRRACGCKGGRNKVESSQGHHCRAPLPRLGILQERSNIATTPCWERGSWN